MRRVLISAHYPARNPYVGLLSDALRSQGVEVIYFTWCGAYFSRYDAFHLHWIESLYSHGGAVSRLLKRAALRLLLLALRLRRVPVVMTVHNPGLHDPLRPPDQRMYDVVMRHVDLRIFMNPEGAENWPRHRIIPHGHYRDALDMAPSRAPSDGHVKFLLFGQIRPYKHIEDLVTPFMEWRSRSATLTIAGASRPPGYAKELGRLFEDDDRITLVDRFLDDADLVALVSASDVVVLPYPRLYNSGALFFALSVGRPVLVVEGEESDRLRSEFGNDWIYTYDERISPADLERVATALRSPILTTWPDMSGRLWETIAMAHKAAFNEAHDHRRSNR